VTRTRPVALRDHPSLARWRRTRQWHRRAASAGRRSASPTCNRAATSSVQEVLEPLRDLPTWPDAPHAQADARHGRKGKTWEEEARQLLLKACEGARRRGPRMCAGASIQEVRPSPQEGHRARQALQAPPRGSVESFWGPRSVFLGAPCCCTLGLVTSIGNAR